MIKIGADPELFILNEDGDVRPAHLFLPGTKQSPHKVECGAIQVDGVAAEFNIDPAECEDEFVYNINTVLSTLRGMIPQEYSLSSSSTVDISPILPELPFNNRILGCGAFYSAYTGRIAPPPTEKSLKGHRCIGGHIHTSWDGEISFGIQCDVMLNMDYLIYFPLQFSNWGEQNKIRMSSYGSPGCFRTKHYGAEYRSLPPSWLDSEDRIRWVFNRTMFAIVNRNTPIWEKIGCEFNTANECFKSGVGLSDCLGDLTCDIPL